jgi:transcriptional regulator with GAF, ATPase, and Fis domain
MIEYKTLYEISLLLNSIENIHELLQKAIDRVIESTNAQRGLLLVFDEVGEINFECARHKDKKDIKKPNSEISRTIIKKVVASGESILSADALHDENFDPSASMRELNLLSIVCSPISLDNKTLGLIYIDNRDITACFDENTKSLLDELASIIAPPLKNSIKKQQLVNRQKKLAEELKEQKGYDKIIGNCPPLQKVFELIDQIADSDAVVLITGETGTGKELVARQIHQKSNQAENELLVLNCSAIPENLLESELFGHEKGAFTGATQKKQGWFERAHHSSIFLDEIGELSPNAQSKLLRLIQFGEITPVGSTKTIKVNVRLITATHRNLKNMVKEGHFRQDLYYRINVIELMLPPLRDRGHDVLELADYFVKKYANRLNKTIVDIEDTAKSALLTYHFPGNVRELENIIQRSVILTKGDIILAETMPFLFAHTLNDKPINQGDINFRSAKKKLLVEFEVEFLKNRLSETKGNISQAAQNAGMYKKNFIDKMNLYNINRIDYQKL